MIRHKLSFAVRLVDDFTGRKIGRTACIFQVDGRLIPHVYKEEGLYLFFEPIESPCALQIEAKDYFPGTAYINRKDLDTLEPVVEVRLYHKPGGSFAYRCSLCCGQLEPSENRKPFMVYGISGIDSGYVLKEKRTVDGKTILVLSGYHKEKLAGHVFGLGNGNKRDVFVIAQKLGMHDYLITETLRYEHKPGEKLVRLFRTYADESGNYVLPVPEGSEDQITVVRA